MRKVIYLVLGATLILSACQNKLKGTADTILVSGKVTNATQTQLTLNYFDESQASSRPTMATKVVKINADGSFADTVNIGNNSIRFATYGETKINMIAKKGEEVGLTFDEKEVLKSIKYTGTNAGLNNFLCESQAHVNATNFGSIVSDLSNEEFKVKADSFSSVLNSCLEKYKSSMTTEQYSQCKQSIAGLLDQTTKMHEQALSMAKLKKGSVSPAFENFTNYNGGKSSLKDFKGHYVYIDIWATWCAPCKQELPYLKQVEEKYKGKNIKFVSISVDKATDESKWRAMVKEKEIGGIKLISDNAFNAQFLEDYGVNSIPRFILIDPEGNIVSADAPRPSMTTEIDNLFSSIK